MKGKIFNAQEVQAIIAGTKTMFREVIKPQPIQLKGFSDVYFDCYSKGNPWNWYTKGNKQPLGTIAKCPYQVGQKIFCKEAFALRDKDGKYFQFRPFKAYKADAESDFAQWKLAQHMKQEHSRLTLEITDIKVERLAEISKEDAIKEGIPLSEEFGDRYYTPENNYAVPKIAFKRWWNATHKKPEEKFEVNPFVWVVDFKINK